MRNEPPRIRLLEKRERDSRCPRCRRPSMKGKRHKDRVPGGKWCSGEPLNPEEHKKEVERDAALAEFRRLREAFWELRRAHRHVEARALCLNGTQVLNYRLRSVARDEADELGIE